MVETQNLTQKRIPSKRLVQFAERVLRKEKRKGKDLSLVFVGPHKMRVLNKRYRGKDKATNVLAFPFDSAQAFGSEAQARRGKPGRELALGEIVLCPSVIEKDAVEYKISFQRAISWMFVHGLLHLLGYDHKTPKSETLMTQKEQHYLSLAQ